MAEVLLNQEQIKKIIPHRDPFLLIDEVLEMEIGKRIVARKYIKADDFWFKGHFPEKPVTPGVLMIEMLAQAGAVCILSQPEFKGKIALFAGIDKAKFRRQVVPGDVLDLSVEIIAQRGPMGVGKAEATVDGKRAVSCEIKFAVELCGSSVPAVRRGCNASRSTPPQTAMRCTQRLRMNPSASDRPPYRRAT